MPQKKLFLSVFLLCVCCLLAAVAGFTETPSLESVASFRAPAVPLVTHDPYFSVWSTSDKLTGEWSKHWTGSPNAMSGLVRIDGKPFRVIGPAPEKVPALDQSSLQIYPTKSVYAFKGEGIELQISFLSPLLANDLKILARPVSYISWQIKSTDGQKHDVSLYLDITGEWVVNTTNQKIEWNRMQIHGMEALRFGSEEQPVLAKKGDNLRIDWGYLYLVSPAKDTMELAIASDAACRDGFIKDGKIPDTDDTRMPRAVSDNYPVMAMQQNYTGVGTEPVSNYLMLAYDDIFSIEYLNRRLQPYWRNECDTIQDMIQIAAKEYTSVQKACQEFDKTLVEDLLKTGGVEFARISTLAYRQCLAAHKLARDFDGKPLHFSKENFSNGCIATVDVIYPASPFFLLFNTELLKAQLKPLLDYCQSNRWTFPFAPHDLGTYPLANGQVYGGGEKTETDQMPVEESGNMLIMLAAMAQIDGNADFVKPYWPVITKWVKFLEKQGLDPANQLCTDDFAGHLAHNSNLSIKAIVALGGYAQMCKMVGDPAAETYSAIAKEMARKWLEMANDGDHYRLAFDKPNTWSQKYNLVWDKLLGLNLFPAELAQKEIAYYKTKINTYGLPLDNRQDYTKTDWELWTATLTTNRDDFELFTKPIAKFITDSSSRVPFTDWYWTQNAKQVGFQARSVIGGVLIPMLNDKATWEKWAKSAK